jgi:hypothetical protein
MRKLLVLFLLSLSLVIQGGYRSVIVLPVETPTNVYDQLLSAVAWVESRNNDQACNVKEMAIGRLQIRESRIQEYNRLAGKNYQHADCYRYEVSREVFLYYCRGRDFETVARAWNGGELGKDKLSTEKYWELVKSKL